MKYGIIFGLLILAGCTSVDARMTVNKDDAFIGSGHYHLAGHGGFSLMKWEGTHSKIDPVLDEMLRNYPKVDMGKPEKTAGNK